MTLAFLVGTGGFLGSLLRYLVSLFIGILPWSYPLGSLCVNLIGSFLIGTALAWGKVRMGESLYHFLVPGLLGGFTTYSAFAGETMIFLQEGFYLSAVSHVLFTTLGCLLTAFLGWRVAIPV